jgi:endo-1,4-beta-mannosidase
MPANAPWAAMWTNWDPAQMQTDFLRAESLGVNTVRLILQVPAFGFPTPSATMLSELHQAVDMASTDQLHVQLTLFDAFGVYDQLANSAQWAEAVLAGYKNDPEIAFVELQNEIDPTNPAAMAWAQYMIPQVSSMLGTVPLTISTSGAGGIESLTLLKQALAGTPISFYDYHY